LLSSLKNSDASSAVSPVIAGLILSCPYFILASISDAPNPRWRICHDAPMLRPIISHSSGLLSHKIGSYIRLAGWEGGAGCGCGWFLGGGCQGGSAILHFQHCLDCCRVHLHCHSCWIHICWWCWHVELAMKVEGRGSHSPFFWLCWKWSFRVAGWVRQSIN